MVGVWTLYLLKENEMNCDVTLTANEFKQIHNTLWAMQYDGMSADTGAEKIREALRGAYEQEKQDDDRKREHYEQVCQDLGLVTVWSIYEVKDLNARHPFEGVKEVVYRNHWGERTVRVPINGLTWAALYVAANAAIRDSGDDHHIFIEHFDRREDSLVLHTGS
jgi:hypothetical protein